MKKIVTTLCCTTLAGLAYSGGNAHSLTVGEGFTNPMGFHDATPAFSWKLPAGIEKQTAYRIEVKGDEVVWDSGWVESEQSVFVPYGGDPLHSRQRLEWRVRFKDETGKDNGWSTSAEFELGLLSKSDWSAKWIRPEVKAESEKEPVGYLKRDFSVSGRVEQARLYVTARGVFEVQLNGEKVGNDHFANGWTSYKHRLDTLTYDVTDNLHSGDNKLDALLGMGWYAGNIGFKGQKQYYGEHPELLLQLEITYSDGSAETIVSDGDWQGTFDGAIRSSSIYNGEEFDAREQASDWSAVVANADLGSARLVPKPFAPVRATEMLAVRNITEPEPGRFVFDLGQNMVGWAKLNIPVEKDQTVTIRFAEMLNTNGTMYTANYRSAKSTDYYTAAETGVAEWEPTFTFHGFRYVELSGLPAGAKPKEDWVTGVVLHSDLPRIGTFESSHEKLNQLQSNIIWGQRGNFLDIPTDCPQRDERLGWTGDAQAFVPTAMFNYDCHAFWKCWLGSMRDDQFPDGRIPHVIPDVLGKGDSPGWMDAATIIPWEVYVRTGDLEVLAENYAMMEKLVGWYRSQSVDGLTPNIKGFGDWLQPYSKETKGDTPHALLGTAFYANSVQVLGDTARVLERADDAYNYDAEAAAVKRAFAKHYFDADGKLQNAPETQTAYLLAIEFNLIPADMQGKVMGHLVRLIGEADNHLRTGFLGTPYLAGVLDRKGHTDLAFDVLFKETYPSWFFSINQGATTMWERWNSYSHEDGFGNVSMNSFNHYAYGAIGQWMYERVAGLAPDPAHPGYKHFFIRPVVGGPLTSARAELETPYGKASSAWELKSGTLTMNITVPPNTTATLVFPNGRSSETAAPGSHRFKIEM
jgi:alpha-L-rhamnosidase